MSRRKEGMKQGFRRKVRLEEALDEFLPLFGAVESEEVGLEGAAGRVAASDVEANRAVPQYDTAAVDGYAVRAGDTHGASERSPVRLETGKSGDSDGNAVYVHAGELVPDDTDAVVRVEETEDVNGTIEVSEALHEGENVTHTGEDVSEGEVVVSEVACLRPSRIAVIRSAGVGTVEVRRKPVVEIQPTGDDVVDENPGRGEVVETNGPMVKEYVEKWGGEANLRDAVPDDEDALADALTTAAKAADMVVTTGGSGVGERDIVPTVVERVGELLVHGVAVKPGGSVGFGTVNSTPVVLLPGHPVSCVVDSFEFVRRGVESLLGVETRPEPTTRCALDGKISSEPGVRTYTRVEVDAEGEETTARPLRTEGERVLSSVADADGFVVTPESLEGHAEGAEVDVLLWEA